MPATPRDLRSDEAQRAVDATPRDAAGWHRLGLEMRSLGRHGDAVQAFTKASSLERGKARYHHDLGNALIDDGKPDRAISAYRRALRIDDSLAEVHNDLGTAYYEKGWHGEAEACFREAIARKPDHGTAHANLGAALRARGQLREARRAFQRALSLKIRAWLPRFLRWRIGAATVAPAAPRAEVREAIEEISRAVSQRGLTEARALALKAEGLFPGEADITYLVAGILGDLGDTRQALIRMRAAIGQKPDRTEFHIALAKLCVRAGDQAGALRAAEKALALEPDSAEAYAALSTAQRASRPDLAEQAARRAIELSPQAADGHDNLGLALWVMGRLDEAEKHARQAVRLSAAGSGYRMNLALILKDAGQLGEARKLYRASSAEAQNSLDRCLNLGTLAMECDADLEGARGWYAKARALGEDPRVSMSEALVDLLDGRLDAAWPRYEARKRVRDQQRHHAMFSGIAAWSGDLQPEKRLLVYAEQGLGDEIMFASMYRDLAGRAARITLVCNPRLEALFRRSFPAMEVVAAPREASPSLAASADLAVAAGSLGMHFRKQAADFPEHHGYLTIDAQQTGRWRERLEALGPGRKIGLSWSGGIFSTGKARRSLALEQLRSLLETPGITWISLQHGDCAAEIADFTARFGIPVHAFPGVTGDIDELASLVQALDLVVSVCNTTVHVAGAIGKEVLVMTPFLPEWRYGLRGERMLWYPSARVFRQPAFGEWQHVIASVAGALAERQA